MVLRKPEEHLSKNNVVSINNKMIIYAGFLLLPLPKELIWLMFLSHPEKTIDYPIGLSRLMEG